MQIQDRLFNLKPLFSPNLAGDYSILRNNVISLCKTKTFEKWREKLLYFKAPKQTDEFTFNELYARFSQDLD
jgi:hypothetical protein